MTDLAIIRSNRSEGIGSSDAKRLIDGDWYRLYQEKIGAAEPEDLSGNFRVQLGIYTESFHLDWLERKYDARISRPNQREYCKEFPLMFAHLDGWHDKLGLPVETKHTSSDAQLRAKAIYYMPQLQHTMAVTGAPALMFSIIAGNAEPEWCEVTRNDEYITELQQLITSFWWHVENKVPPEITPTAKMAAIQKIGASVPIDGLRAYDMTGDNQWANHAADYVGNMAAARVFEDAKARLKSLVPDDAAECSGHGITIKRDKRGSLRFGS